MLELCSIASGSSGNCICVGSDDHHVLIDAGISGKTAQLVAEKLNTLSKTHQIICITHLPQIAAMADNHYVIEKSTKDNRTISNITKLSYDESIGELARMLGGSSITDAVVSNAKELKNMAQTAKNN